MDVLQRRVSNLSLTEHKASHVSNIKHCLYMLRLSLFGTVKESAPQRQETAHFYEKHVEQVGFGSHQPTRRFRP